MKLLQKANKHVFETNLFLNLTDNASKLRQIPPYQNPLNLKLWHWTIFPRAWFLIKIFVLLFKYRMNVLKDYDLVTYSYSTD